MIDAGGGRRLLPTDAWESKEKYSNECRESESLLCDWGHGHDLSVESCIVYIALSRGGVTLFDGGPDRLTTLTSIFGKLLLHASRFCAEFFVVDLVGKPPRV